LARSWDVFDLFNHPGFGFPNAAIGNPTVGRIATTIVDNGACSWPSR
jgi:hypothetical protein